MDFLGGDYVADIPPGEIWCISETGIRRNRYTPPRQSRFCVFEWIYFLHGSSTSSHQSVADMRRRFGCELAAEAPVAADLIVPVPDSAIHAAEGYAMAAGLYLRHAITRSRYLGRTFIEQDSRRRTARAAMKYFIEAAAVRGRRLVLIDDSLVRGTTLALLVKRLRAAGAAEIHIRIASPPFAHPCYFGVDTPSREELRAAAATPEKIAETIGADSLRYLSVAGLYHALTDGNRRGFCDACFTGDYPSPIPGSLDLIPEFAAARPVVMSK